MAGGGGLNEEILDLVSRGKPKNREDGGRVTAHDLFSSSSSSSEAEAEEEQEEEVIPRKRRASPKKAAVDDEQQELSDGYDANLYGDAEDRKRLAAMTEIDREAVLYERAQTRLARAERKALERKVRDMELKEEEQQRQQRAQRAPSAATEKKRQTLDALVAARERKQKKSKRSGADDSDYTASDAEDGQVEEEEVEVDSQDNDDDYSHYASTKKSSSSSSPVKKGKKASLVEPIDFELVNKNRLSRNVIAQWIFHPDFDDLAKGSFLRLAIGPGPNSGDQVYRLVEVKKIVPYYRTYKIGQLSVNKAALLRYGKSERTFRLDVISNSDFTQQEYHRWLGILKDESLQPPSKKSALLKAEAWSTFLAQPVSDEIVRAMVAAKKEVGNAHRNLIAERTHLLNQREEAISCGNTEEVDQIDAELTSIAKEIEQSQANRQGSTRLEALAEINRRNRQLNVSIAREAEKVSASHRGSSSGGTALRMDPFSRRKCQPSNFHEFGEDGDELKEDATNGDSQQQQEQQSSPQPQTPAPAGKLDLFAVHDLGDDFDIDI